MKRKNVLITGGAGYIGSHTAKLLQRNNYNIIIFDNLSTGFKKLAKYGLLVIGDLYNKNQIDDVFKNYSIDVVFHFAANAYIGESMNDPQKYYKNNVNNTLTLLEAMLENDVKKIIFSSSCATFGTPVYLPIDEKHPQNPINPYGRTKLIVEKILKDYENAYNLKYVILRYFNAAGADKESEIGEMHNPETHLIPNAIKSILCENATLNVHGSDYDTKDGTCIRDYIHVDDLALAHLKAYEYLNKYNKSDDFNLGTKNGYSILQIINTIQKISSQKLVYTFKNRRAGDPSKLIASSSKAEKLLEWKPQYSDIDTIINSALEWHKKVNND